MQMSGEFGISHSLFLLPPCVPQCPWHGRKKSSREFLSTGGAGYGERGNRRDHIFIFCFPRNFCLTLGAPSLTYSARTWTTLKLKPYETLNRSIHSLRPFTVNYSAAKTFKNNIQQKSKKEKKKISASTQLKSWVGERGFAVAGDILLGIVHCLFIARKRTWFKCLILIVRSLGESK